VYVTNVENKIRTTEISKIPVELINTEALTNSKLALTPNQELYVTLKVEGNTSDINKIKKSDFKVQVDLSEYAWKKGENKVPVTIVDYPITVSLKNNNALTVSIRIEDMVEKSMPVTSNIKVNTREGYFASEATIK
ncbi:CdaR family protein, partial [Clostridium perfringens]